MALVQINWRPDRDELRKFGFISLAAFGVLGLWLFFRNTIFGVELSPDRALLAAYFCWALAGGGLAGSLAAPEALRPMYVILTAISLPIGFVVSHVLMGIVFFGLLTPVGIFFRLIGRDALQRQFDRSATSYWQPRPITKDRAHYFKQF
jgi:polyferredoxin